MARKLMYILYQDCPFLSSRRATHATPELNVRACNSALERPQDQGILLLCLCPLTRRRFLVLI